jgi:signal transduction histidine kinase
MVQNINDAIRSEGTALLCDSQGNILELLCDSLGIIDSDNQNITLTQIVDRMGLNKLLNFLVELRTQGSAFDWELNVSIDGHIVPLHWSCIITDEKIIIICSRTYEGVFPLIEELMKIGNEQIAIFRSAFKDRSELTKLRLNQERETYNEISRLNNELINLQRELAKKNAKLERLNEQKNYFLGMAAHDLRSPLNAIYNYSDFLLGEVSDILDEEQLEFIKIIRSSSKYMAQIVNDFLDIATIESGKMELNLWITDLKILISDNVKLNRVLAAKKNIELTFSHGDDIPLISVDASKIDQVLNNLISNAIKFSSPRTTVEIHFEKIDEEVLISIKDEGPGIPVDQQERLFNFFERSSIKRTAGEKSTGLGLAIVKKIVLAHHGKLRIDSEVGKGAKFNIFLPLNLDKEIELI